MNRSKTSLTLLLAAAVLLPTAGGCSWFRKDKPKPRALRSTNFQHTLPSTSPATDNVANLPVIIPAPPSTQTSSASTNIPLYPEVKTPTDAAPTTTATKTPAPKTALPVPTLGTYMTIGGVVAEVNGVPVFATQVMRTIEPVLATRAKELDERRFTQEATSLVDRQINELINDELAYATAQRNLLPEDKKISDAAAADYRRKKIIEAGGSLELARKAAAEAGDNFEDMVKRENRRILVILFYQKKLSPRVAITTGDMRRYYSDNVDKLFTEHATATFRLIRIDPNRSGGKDAALTKIKSLRDQATSGADFATLASTSNDDSNLKNRKGLVADISKNSLAMEKVEAAVFATRPGQLTDIIEDRGGFYLAKVESLTQGSVKSFETSDVQQKIDDDLRRLQVSRLREQFEAELRKNAVIRRDKQMIQTALEMISQRYPAWRAAQ